MARFPLHLSLFSLCIVTACQAIGSKNSTQSEHGASAMNNDCDPEGNPSPDSDFDTAEEDTVEPDCLSYDSDLEEYAPIQEVGAGLPAETQAITWTRPADFVYYVDFSGTPGQSANHEGTDYVHNDQEVDFVFVHAAAEGRVVYVRTGCPQSSVFSRNTDLRECGSGWGNHIIVEHEGVFTRYGHLAPESVLVQVGDEIERGDKIALMGNTGRSELRHLHLELGTTASDFDPCAPAQSFELVYDPEPLF